MAQHNTALTEIGQRLDHLPVGPMHRRVVVAIGLGLFFEIYEIFLSSTISTTLKTQYDLDGTTLKLLLASTFVGMFIGSAALGGLADRIGRRRAFLFNLVWFSTWSLIGAFSPAPWFLVATRFLAGIGVGAEYPVADAYLSDVLPKTDRGRLAAWAYTWSFVAVPALGFLSLALTKRSLLGIPGWRLLLVLGAVGAVLVMLMRRGLPESPRWLASVGRDADARAALAQFETGAPPAPAAPDEPAPAPAVATNPIARLRISPYPERLGMLGVFHVCQAFGYYGFGTLAALVLVSRGYDVTSSLLYTALSFLGYPVGSALSVPLFKRVERKYLVLATIAALAAFGLLFATVPSPALIVLFGFLTTATSNVFSNVYHVYQAEIFPTDVRATAVGWTYSLSRLSSAALPFVLIPVLDDYGAGAMFTVVLVALGIAAGVVAWVGPRTSRRNLEEINPV
ncbi:MFS transporter [Mycolicibacterium madagascariense]|uniref:MFS transporter n=1 Tax=Mycolicibacterium madagascariense TaxID=212765 RepID=A0A7I7XN54_9MYCO|nr:MFS transporter [Mycolicibacterium madagascariense]BBZ30482.1 MFS transporter [Mycolicibacterium madagascariense]